MSEHNSQQMWAGQRLGFPQSGPGSLAKMGRRLLALCIDWGASLVISNWLFHNTDIATVIVFGVEQWLLVATAQASFGHRIAGLKIVKLDGNQVGFYAALIRSALLCIVIPAAIWDNDNRGLHDKAANTALVLR